MLLTILLYIYIGSVLVSLVCHAEAFSSVLSLLRSITFIKLKVRLIGLMIGIFLLSFVPIFNTWVALCYLKKAIER